MFYTRGYMNDKVVQNVRDIFKKQSETKTVTEKAEEVKDEKVEKLDEEVLTEKASAQTTSLKDIKNKAVEKGNLDSADKDKVPAAPVGDDDDEEVEKEDEDLEEGYKIGDMVNVTNPKATPRHQIVGKTKTHYAIKKDKGDIQHFPKERIARVNKQRFDRLKANVTPNRLKGSDIPVREDVEFDDVEQLDEVMRIAYKKVGPTHYRSVEKGTWRPVPKNVEIKKVGNTVHVRKDKGTWIPKGPHVTMESVLSEEEIEKINATLASINESESKRLSKDLPAGYHTVAIHDDAHKSFQMGDRVHVKSHGDDVKAGLAHVKSVNNAGNNYQHKLVYHDGKGNFHSTHHEKGTPTGHYVQRA